MNNSNQSLYNFLNSLNKKGLEEAIKYSQKRLSSSVLSRKGKFMAKATAHFDTPKIRKEASKLFDKQNES